MIQKHILFALDFFLIVMYIELKCRSCGKAFHVDFTNNEYDVDKCPKCRSHLIFSDVARIKAITEPFYTNVSRTDGASVYILSAYCG